MGQMDMQTRAYVKRPEVFADLFNYFIYRGKSVISPEHLKELDPAESLFFSDSSRKVQASSKVRDVLKSAVIMEDAGTAYALILGVENQTNVQYAMPVKNMAYDAYNYVNQVSSITRRHRRNKDSTSSEEFLSGFHKSDPLTPVITLVVHFGLNPWDGPMSIHEMLPVKKKSILRLIPDYKINLLSPISMDMNEIKRFQSDFREVASFIRCGNDKNALQALMQDDTNFRHMDPLTAGIVNDITNAGLKLDVNERGEIDMCKAIAGIREEGLSIGRTEGMSKGISIGRTEGISIGRSEGISIGRTKGISEGISIGKTEGISIGKDSGRTEIFDIMQKLFSVGRGADVQKMAEDETFRQEMLKEFGLN